MREGERIIRSCRLRITRKEKVGSTDVSQHAIQYEDTICAGMRHATMQNIEEAQGERHGVLMHISVRIKRKEDKCRQRKRRDERSHLRTDNALCALGRLSSTKGPKACRELKAGNMQAALS